MKTITPPPSNRHARYIVACLSITKIVSHHFERGFLRRQLTVIAFIVCPLHFFAQSPDFFARVNLFDPSPYIGEKDVLRVISDENNFIWGITKHHFFRFDGFNFIDLTNVFGSSKELNFTNLAAYKKNEIIVFKGVELFKFNISSFVLKKIDLADFKMLYGAGAFFSIPRFYTFANGACWTYMNPDIVVRLDSNFRITRMLTRVDWQQINKRPPLIDKPAPGQVQWRVLSDSVICGFSQRGEVLRIYNFGSKVINGRNCICYSMAQKNDSVIAARYIDAADQSLVEKQYFRLSGLQISLDSSSASDEHLAQASVITFGNTGEFEWSMNELGYYRKQRFFNLTDRLFRQGGSATIAYCYVDPYDNTWLCTSNGLICMTIQIKKFDVFMMNDPSDASSQFLYPVSIRSICEAGSNNMYISSYGGLYKKTRKVHYMHVLNPQTGITKDLNIPFFRVNMKVELADKYVWAVSDGNSISKYKITGASLKESHVDFPGVHFATMYRVSANTFWLGTYTSQIVAYNIVNGNSKIINLALSQSGKTATIRQVLAAGNGKFWLATSTGLFLADSAGVVIKGYAGQENEAVKLPGFEVMNICAYGHSMWLATEHNGIFELDTVNKILTNYTIEQGLADNRVLAIVPDDFGCLWISTYNGISRFEVRKKQFTNYTTKDGLPNNEFNYNAYLYSSDHKIYFGGLNGIVKIDPADFVLKDAKPSSAIHLSSFSKYSVFQKKQVTYFEKDIQNNIDVYPGEEFLSFNFMTGNYGATENKAFRYRVIGLADSAWKLLPSGNEITITSLPPGHYVLSVKVADDGKGYSGEEYAVKITSHPHWYNTWWSYLIAVIIAGSLIFFIYYIKITRFKELIKIRQNLSEDLHDSVGSTLSNIGLSVQSMFLLPNNERHYQLLQKIKKNINAAQDDLRDIVWSMRLNDSDFRQTVQRMIGFANEILEYKQIDFTYRIEEKVWQQKVPLKKQKEIYLIFKEAINNCAKHSNSTNVRVIMQLTNSSKCLEVSITDNGVGFNSNVAASLGNGIRNIHHRASKIGQLDIRSERDAGTSLILRVKI